MPLPTTQDLDVTPLLDDAGFEREVRAYPGRPMAVLLEHDTKSAVLGLYDVAQAVADVDALPRVPVLRIAFIAEADPRQFRAMSDLLVQLNARITQSLGPDRRPSRSQRARR